jgi:hypothetical protein
VGIGSHNPQPGSKLHKGIRNDPSDEMKWSGRDGNNLNIVTEQKNPLEARYFPEDESPVHKKFS